MGARRVRVCPKCHATYRESWRVACPVDGRALRFPVEADRLDVVKVPVQSLHVSMPKRTTSSPETIPVSRSTRRRPQDATNTSVTSRARALERLRRMDHP